MPASRRKDEFAVALSLFKAGKLDEALTVFDKCIEREPASHQFYDARAATLEKLQRLKEALRDARKVVELCPEQAKGYARSARLFLMLGKHERALDMCALASERLPLSEVSKRAEIAGIRKHAVHAIGERNAASAPQACHVHKLPYEILSMAFQYWMQLDVCAPVIASHVCRRWRETAISNSKLWSTLSLGRYKPEVKAETWMQRSLSRCVDLRVTINFRFSEDRRHWLANFVRSVEKSLTRLDLNIPARLYHPIIVENLSKDALESLQVLILDLSVSGDDRTGYLYPFDPTRFKSLRWLDLSGGVTMLSGALQCPALEYFRFSSTEGSLPALARFRSMVAGLPALRELSLECGHQTLQPGGEMPSDEPVPLPHLERLDLAGRLPWSTFTQNMKMPTLQALRLTYCLTKAEEIIANLQPKVPPITDLCITSSALTESSLRTMLYQFTGLVRLEVSRTAAMSNTVLEHLVESNQPPRWPHLQHLNFAHCPLISGGPLLRLVRSHLPNDVDNGEAQAVESAIQPIKSLTIDGCPKVDQDVAEKLRGLVPVFSCIYITRAQLVRGKRMRDRYM